MSAFAAVVEATNRRIDELNRELARRVAEFDRSLASIGSPEEVILKLREAGVNDFVNREISQTYADIAKENLRIFRAEYGDNFEYTDEMIARMQKMQQVSALGMQGAVSEAAQKITAQLELEGLGVISKGGALNAMRDIAERNLSRYLQIETETAISNFATISRTELAESAGIDKFEYFGPTDARTRQFCQNHAGQVKTKEEWQAIDNGQNGSAWPFRGGYNCRHQFLPVDDE